MKRFWVSWCQPTEDYRPLRFPPMEEILGWWCSGECEDGDYILCALVQAADEELARGAITLEWPEASDWRFFEECPLDYVPGDRFPLADWMRARVYPAPLPPQETP